MRLLASLLVAWVFALMPAPADAHKASDAYLTLKPAGASIAVRWDIALRDLQQVLDLDRNASDTIEWSEVVAQRAAIIALALGAIEFDSPAGACRPGPVSLQLARRGDGTYAALQFDAVCVEPPETLAVGYRLFAGVDPTHRAIVSVAGADVGLTVLRPDGRPLALALEANRSTAPSVRWTGFFTEGVHHILGGFDHLAFLLALLIPSIAFAGNTDRRLGATLLDLVRLVTLFTLAHSVTLALTAMQFIDLPSRLVESLVAASVVFAGWHAFVASRRGPESPRGLGVAPWLVFAFGLVHGFGFGSALLDSGFGGGTALAALIGFNLGVEAGQLLVLAALFPLAWAMRNGASFRHRALPALSLLIVLAGSGWLLGRVFDIELVASAAGVS